MKMARGYYLWLDLWRSLTWVQGEFSLFLSCQTALMLYCADAGNRKQSSGIELLYLCLLASVRHVSRGSDSSGILAVAAVKIFAVNISSLTVDCTTNSLYHRRGYKLSIT